jgi:hypothetical protein
MARPSWKPHRAFLPWLGFALIAFASGCVHYDVPLAVRRAPGEATVGVALSKSRGRYKVTTITRLNGSVRLSEKPTVRIASGSVANWQWAVKAVPSAVPGWKAWLTSKKIAKLRQEDARPGSWAHAAAGWDSAFGRAHRVVRYLLGRQPPALHATLLLLPPGVKYSRAITRTGNHYFPLTLAFNWPTSNQLAEPASLAKAVTTTVYEYQHLLVDSNVIPPTGRTAGARAANDEARSHCWSQSTFLALESGTEAYIEYKVSRSRVPTTTAVLEESMPKLTVREEVQAQKRAPGRRPHIRFSDGLAWGTFFEIQSLANYLQLRGNPKLRVTADEPSQMNAILSVCRAMTQQPLDITATDGYPPSKVKFVPFFPANLKAPKRKSSPNAG